MDERDRGHPSICGPDSKIGRNLKCFARPNLSFTEVGSDCVRSEGRMLGALELRASIRPSIGRENLPVAISSTGRGAAAASPSNVHGKSFNSCSPPESVKIQAENSSNGQPDRLRSRRQALSGLLLCSTALQWAQCQTSQEALAEEESKKEGSGDKQKEESVFEGLKSLFDPNETTKSGKNLPKAYLKSARDVVSKMRDSFNGDFKNETEFRRNADSAKEAIREYVANWRGSKEVASEESYQALEKALRVLGEFYSKQGPRAMLPEDVRARVLESLQTADDNL